MLEDDGFASRGTWGFVGLKRELGRKQKEVLVFFEYLVVYGWVSDTHTDHFQLGG